MVRYKDLNAPVGEQIAGMLRDLRVMAQSSKTVPAGVKDLGDAGDVVWTDRGVESGRRSVRDVASLVDAAAERAGEVSERLTIVEGDVSAAADRLHTVETVTIPQAVARLEQADVEARESLSELDQRLSSSPWTGDLSSVRRDLAAAQDAARAAQATADKATLAASAANQAALEAAGIADSKGKVIYAEAEPGKADQSASNLWIKPSTEETRVWNGEAWELITSDLLDKAAQNALDAKDAAAKAQSTAEAAAARAETAVANAAEAQRTAEKATLDARDAHNAAVQARQAADDAAEKYGPLDARTQAAEAAARAAQERADAAHGLAESKPDQKAVQEAARAAQDAATKAAAADAQVKAEAAKQAALEVAARDAQQKAAAAQAAAEEAAREAARSEAGTARQAAEAEAKRLADAAEKAAKAAAALDATAKANAAQKAAAEDAKAKADKALQDALAALRAARGEITAEIKASVNGKNAITISTAAPGRTPGVVSGDTWWRTDEKGQIFGQWQWDGKAWQPVLIRSEVIANLDVHKLQVTGDARIADAVVDRLFADIFAAKKITASELSIASIGPDGGIAKNAVTAVSIKDGAVTTPKLTVTSDMAAKIVSALTIEAKKIIVTGESLAGVHLSEKGLIATDGENTLELNGKGLGLYTQGPDGLEEQVYLGPSGENLLTIGTSTIAKGAISAEQGAFDTLTVGGEDITTLVTSGPRGLIAWGKSEQLGQWDGTGNEIWRLQVNAVLYPGRMYRVTSSSHYVQTRSKLPNSVTEWLRCKDITDGVNVTSSSPQLASMIHQIPQAGAYTVPSMTAIIDGTAINAAEDGTKFQFVVSSATRSDVRYSASSVTPWTLTVEDIGPTMEAAGSSWVHTGTPTGGSADTSVTKPPAATRIYKSTWTPSYGGDISSGQIIQGTYPGVGERWGGWVMPSAMRSEMRAAKSIAKVEVYLYAEHWYYGAGGTAVIRPNNGTYKGTVFGNNNVTSGRWPRKAGRWVTLPSSWYPHIMSGTYKGVSVKQSSSSLEQYGRFNATATRFRVTYTK